MIASGADQDYLLKREIEERAIARVSKDPVVRDVHFEMAALYAVRREPALAVSDGAAPVVAKTSRKIDVIYREWSGR